MEALNIDVKGGEFKLVASDDGLNAAGGTDSSGTTGGRDGMFGGGKYGMGGGMSSGNGSIVIYGGNLYVKASGTELMPTVRLRYQVDTPLLQVLHKVILQPLIMII